MFEACAQRQGLAIAVTRNDGVLRHRFGFMFNFNGQVQRRQHIACHAQDVGQLGRFKSVLQVYKHPCLQQASFGFAQRAAAVHEVFDHMAHFGDVKVGCDCLAIGQQDLEVLVGMGFEQRQELFNVHVYSFQNQQQLVAASGTTAQDWPWQQSWVR